MERSSRHRLYYLLPERLFYSLLWNLIQKLSLNLQKCDIHMSSSAKIFLSGVQQYVSRQMQIYPQKQPSVLPVIECVSFNFEECQVNFHSNVLVLCLFSLSLCILPPTCQCSGPQPTRTFQWLPLTDQQVCHFQPCAVHLQRHYLKRAEATRLVWRF